MRPAHAALIVLSLVTSVCPGAAQVPGRVGPAVALVPVPPRPSRPLPKEAGAVDRLTKKLIGASGCPVGDVKCAAQKIVGPGVAAPKYGYVVAIFYNKADGGRYICTGTLLTPRLVLTAGHCGCGIPGSYTVDFRLDARGGIENRVANVEGSPILFDQRVCRSGSLGNGHDLALIRLVDTIQDEDKDRPSLAGYPADLVWKLRDRLVPSLRLLAVGYGFTQTGEVGFRNQVTIPIASADCAARRYRGVCMPFGEMVLAEAGGPRIRADTCGGDSGGPVFLMGQDSRPTLIAVTSRAAPGVEDDPVHHCGGGGIYVLIGRQSVHDWLRANGVNEIGATGAPAQPPAP